MTQSWRHTFFVSTGLFRASWAGLRNTVVKQSQCRKRFNFAWNKLRWAPLASVSLRSKNTLKYFHENRLTHFFTQLINPWTFFTAKFPFSFFFHLHYYCYYFGQRPGHCITIPRHSLQPVGLAWGNLSESPAFSILAGLHGNNSFVLCPV